MTSLAYAKKSRPEPLVYGGNDTTNTLEVKGENRKALVLKNADIVSAYMRNRNKRAARAHLPDVNAQGFTANTDNSTRATL